MSFKKDSLPFLLLVGLCIRSVSVGAHIGDAIGMGALAALQGFLYYLESKREAPINDQIKAEIEELKAKVSGINSSMQLKSTVGVMKRGFNG